MRKFNRNYKLQIQLDSQDEVIVIEPPLTIQLDIVRNTSAQANTMNLTVYNLKESTRNKIFQDLFDLSSRRRVILQAGYGSELSTIFVGSLRKAYSRRQQTEVLTEMYCWDDGGGDVLNAFSNNTLAAGSSIRDIIKTAAGGMRNTAIGEIGELDETPIPRGTSLVGNSFQILNKYANGNVFIDNEQLNILKPNEVIEGLVPLINSSSGLLGTPQRQDAKLMIDMIFEPRIRVGQVIEVDSSIQKQFNGQFKVIGIKHSGIISESVSGELRTSLELFIPNVLNNQSLSLVKNGKVTPLSYGKVNANIRGVYGYLLKFGAPPALNITSGIKWEDVLKNYSQQGSTPTIQTLANLVRTAEAIQQFVDTYYPGRAIKVSSGWRSKQYNSSTPGASATSKHVQGLALDWFIVGVPISEQHVAVRRHMVGEIITYSWGQHYGLQSNKEVRSGDR